MITRDEFCPEDSGLVEWLDAVGAQGWELVHLLWQDSSADWAIFPYFRWRGVFKRPGAQLDPVQAADAAAFRR